MSTTCQTYIDPVYQSDPCNGERKSAGCVVDSNIYTDLGLEANSTQQQINQAFYTVFLAQKALIENLQQQIDNL